jgi:hypothetical protein
MMFRHSGKICWTCNMLAFLMGAIAMFIIEQLK